MGHIRKGSYGIEVMMNDCLGKRPGLYVYSEKENCAVKVGNFASEEKAQIFEGYLKWLTGLGGEPKEG